MSVPTTHPHGRMERNWLSKRDAAEYIGVTDRTIGAYIAKGILPAYRIGAGRLVRIDRSDLDALAHRIPTGGAA